MSLLAKFNDLETSLSVLEEHITGFVLGKPTITGSSDFSFAEECLLEGLLSRVWQAWGVFCRECVIDSCLGTTTSDGAVIAAVAGALSEHHVSGAAVYAKKPSAKPPYWRATNAILRNEPTWGDVDVLSRLINRLQPSNGGQMLAAFSAGSAAAKALQTIRNCAAHFNIQTLTEVMHLAPSYITYPIGHPAQAMFWIEPKSKDYLVSHALTELRVVAELAIG